MFTLYPIVKEKTDLVHCEQGRVLSVALQVLFKNLKNGAKWSCSGAEIVPKVASLVWAEAYSYKFSATLFHSPMQL